MTGNAGHVTMWSDERMTDLLVDMFNDGGTVLQIQSAIGERFKVKVTRSSVCGRISRLRQSTDRIKRSKEVQTKPRKTHAEKLQAKAEYRKRYNAERREARKEVKPRAVSVKPEPLPIETQEPLAMRLEDLTPAQCRYPHGNGPFTFCGCETAPGRVYCAAHAARCYQVRYVPDPTGHSHGPKFGQGYGVGPVPGAFVGRGHGLEG